MAVTITRTARIDDDGSGTTGTVINNAEKTSLYNEIDAALAQVAQLTGGNTFTGNQAINGILNVNSTSSAQVAANPSGNVVFSVQNTAAGTNAQSRIHLGNDADVALFALMSFSSTYTTNVFNYQSGSILYQGGAGGLSIAAITGGLRFYAGGGGAERMRIAPTGDVLIGTTVYPTGVVGLGLVIDASAKQPLAIQNAYTGGTGTLVAFTNYGNGPVGSITQTGLSNVAYNTTSDRRLKDDAGRAIDLAALRAVVVHDFAWKADGRADRGVFAQDAHAVFPRAVTVGTDATTDDGTLQHPWMTDYSKFVPDLIVGWQQHDADLAEIRAALATLKGSH